MTMGDELSQARLRSRVAARRKNLLRGRAAEWVAGALLTMKGYRILVRRLKTPAGEIDIVAARGKRIAFVEVKYRPDVAGLEAAIGPRQRARIRRASELWIARNPRYREHEVGFDIVFVSPRRLPRHIPNAL